MRRFFTLILLLSLLFAACEPLPAPPAEQPAVPEISGIDFGYVQANSTFNRVCEFELFKAQSWVESNFKVIAVISSPNADYDNRYEVINSAMCEIGATAEYEYK